MKFFNGVMPSSALRAWFPGLLLLSLLMPASLTVQAEGGDPRSIVVDLALEQSLRSYADKDWVVYVFAKPSNSRVPVAAKAVKLNQLPLQLTLSEKDYLLEKLTLASSDQVTVNAKVSRAEEPHKTVVGDLLGQSPVIDLSGGGQRRVQLRIDREVK